MSNSDQTQKSIPGVIFGAIFALVGAVVFVFISFDFAKTVGTYGWEKVPAEIDSITIAYPKKAPAGRKHDVFELKAQYTYLPDDGNGQKREGTALRRKPFKDDSYEKLAARRWDLITNEISHAYVDPKDPTHAIIERDSLWGGLLLLFPVPFLAIGLGVMAASLGFFSSKSQSKKDYVSQRTHGQYGGCAVVAFGSCFALVGGVLLFVLLINPLLTVSQAQNWTEVPCEVIWSRVRVHDGEDGDTYAPDIFYEYKFNGEFQRTNRYAFNVGTSSGRGRKQAIVRKYSAGTKTHCFVDPAKPWRAVLNRDRNQIGFWWLIPFVFFGVGIAIMIAGFRTRTRSDFFDKKKKSKKRTKSSLFSASESTGDSDEDTDASKAPQTFRSRGAKFGRFAGTVFVAAFWNGIAGVIFVDNWLKLFQGGKVDYFLLLFSIPFLIIGILLLAGVLYSFGALFNSNITLIVEPGSPRTGQELLVDWNVSGGLTRFRRLRIMLEGIESASYTRGTTRVTDEETFYRRLLVDESDRMSIRSGSVIFEIPLGVMPTLDLIDNNIAWRITVEGTVPRWPNVFDIYEIEVLPFATGES